MDFEKMALDWWNGRADEHNQWDDLSECEQSMICAAFYSGSEAMREAVVRASQQRIDQWREMGALRAADAGYAILSIIRAMPGKEG